MASNPRSSVRRRRALLAFVLGFSVASGCTTAAARPRTPASEDGAGEEVTVTTVAEPPEPLVVAPAEPEVNPRARALLQALIARLSRRTDADGAPVLPSRCVDGPVPCLERLTAFAVLIEEVARRYELDPYLIGALALRESGLDPSVIGRRREAGIVQLHPRGVGRGVRFVEDAEYRAACQTEIAACQDEVLDHGVRALSRLIESCGGLPRGLGAYASGRCGRGATAAARVLRERDELRAAAPADATSP